MLIAKVQGNQVLEVADYTAMFPDTSFPANGPDAEWMAENSCMNVNLWLPYDQATQVLASATPYIMDNWVYTVEVRDMTPEELAAYQDSLLAKVKSQAQQLLIASDWTELSSVTDIANTPHLDNSAEWVAYRLELRSIAVTPTVDAVFPVMPEEIWTK